MRLSLLILILIFALNTVFLAGCGRAPTGQTDYRKIKEEMQSGSAPPPPAHDSKDKPKNQGG